MYFEIVIENVKLLVLENPNLAAFYLIIGKIIGAIILAPGTPLTLLAGATLGTFKGFITSMIGNTIGAVAAFFIARCIGQKYITEKILPKYPKIKEYEERLTKKKGLQTVLFLRLVPLFPFNALNYLLGITNVSAKNYIIGTFFGIIPGTLAFVYFGESLRMLKVANIIIAILAIMLLIVGGKYYEKKELKNK
jgi:uncharacterized membrane protein YdjX (TVP38/TMEM64 family)